MKTIKFLSQTIQLAKTIGTPANIEVGTFKVKSKGLLSFSGGKFGTFDNYRLSFQIEFLPKHIQYLFEMGVEIDLENCVMANLSPNSLRFKKGREAIKQGNYAPYYYFGNPANKQIGIVENWLHASASCTIDVLEKLEAFCRDNHLHHLAIHNATILEKQGWVLKNRTYATKPNEKIERIQKLMRKNINEKRKNIKNLLPVEKRAITKTQF